MMSRAISMYDGKLVPVGSGEISPLKYQLQSSIETVSKTTQLYVERKADEAISAVLNAIAPGQSSILLARIFKQKADNNQGSSDNYYDEMFNSLIKLYNEADNNIVKEQLLSIMASKTTKEQLLNRIPGLTKYRVDKVRMMNFQSIYDQHDQPPVKRSRMDPVKLEHALSFFFNPAFHQIVSYGTRDIKLESGEVITVPEVVRTACHSTLIDMYNSYSEENEFTPLSRATLYNILNVCSASKRRNLHGLDNITADGHSGFELIEKLIKGIENEDIISREKKNELIQQLKSGKEYLKGDYKLHISPNSECADHCIKWGLSDPKVPNYQSKCDHDHSIKCDRCDNISSVLIKVSNLPFGSDDKTELKLALDQIENWKCHIMRTVNQDLARTDMFDNMSECQAVMVNDWAMKFLPCSHREKQSDWFGQKGLSWHVAVCIYKEKKDDQVNLKHQTFVHILESASKQDWIAVAAFIRHTLSEISVQMGHLKEVFLRSDNAGCYHCGNLWIALNCISQQTGIKIKRYDYSEAQSGKSYCDAKIAHLRQKIRMYVANGNNVTTAEEMKQAIDEGLGVAGCQVAVVDVNADQSELQKVKHKWSGINSITNLEVHEHSITQYKAYNIGNGKLVDNVNSLCSTDLSQALPNLTIIQPFTTCSFKPKDTETLKNIQTEINKNFKRTLPFLLAGLQFLAVRQNSSSRGAIF
ncbi:Hypothetical predicted protein [Mytilus galloprovincialis]|uniref:Uncharacterized protein n=1 Tax=Mytilus galloprovincialis TaxID=29158 RepID=A0A8B6ER73_MYTGA|nr:Hypothetical predicted protein [Mytilus galloprovincialis]